MTAWAPFTLCRRNGGIGRSPDCKVKNLLTASSGLADFDTKTREEKMGYADSVVVSGEGEVFNAAGARRAVAYTIRQRHLNGTVQKFGEMGAANLAGLDLLKDRTFRLKLDNGRAVPIEIITQRARAVHFGIKSPTSSF
jgi:hypothetical protein